MIDISYFVNKSLARQIDIDFDKVDEKIEQMISAHVDDILENQKDECNSDADLYTEAINRTFVDIFSEPNLSDIERLYYAFHAGGYYQAFMTGIERMADLKGLTELFGRFLNQDEEE